MVGDKLASVPSGTHFQTPATETSPVLSAAASVAMGTSVRGVGPWVGRREGRWRKGSARKCARAPLVYGKGDGFRDESVDKKVLWRGLMLSFAIKIKVSAAGRKRVRQGFEI
jgi:hypothetical protein